MIRRLCRRLAGIGNPDPEALFSELSSAAQPGYGGMDRYRDFRAVFLGSDQGRRVLHEVLGWGHVFRASAQAHPIDPYRMAFHEGERNLALKLLATINHEPSEKPTQTTRKQGD